MGGRMAASAGRGSLQLGRLDAGMRPGCLAPLPPRRPWPSFKFMASLPPSPLLSWDGLIAGWQES